MKKLIPLACLAAFALSSCCKKTACVQNADMAITFYGFTAAEVDTVITTGYALGSMFSKVTRAETIDTAGHFTHMPDRPFCLVLKRPPSTNAYGGGYNLSFGAYEWKLYIPAVNKTILITNYGYQTYNCNPCGIRKGKEIRSLSTCSVNDSTKNVDDIRIYK